MLVYEGVLLAKVARYPELKNMLRRWAFRYAGNLLSKLGGVHTPSAQLLLGLGERTAVNEDSFDVDLLEVSDVLDVTTDPVKLPVKSSTRESVNSSSGTIVGWNPEPRTPATNKLDSNENPPLPPLPVLYPRYGSRSEYEHGFCDICGAQPGEKCDAGIHG